jgi:hypothetical protein
MDVDLPPVIVVRRLLRHQQQRRDDLNTWIEQAYNDGFTPSHAGKRSRLQRIRLFAEGFDKKLKSAGAFNVSSSGSLDRLKLKSESGFSANGHVLWPVTFGRNLNGPGPVYTEQHLMLAQVGGDFTPAKASVYEVPLLLSWTRHALERICERTNVGNNLYDELSSSAIHLAKTFAIARVLKLIKGDADPDQTSQTAWLPYQDGLVIVTQQAAFAHRLSHHRGWKLSFNKRRVIRDLVKSSRSLPLRTGPPGTIDDDGNPTFELRNLMSMDTWVVTTFIARGQLSVDQEKLRLKTMELVDCLPNEAAGLMYKLCFDSSYGAMGIEVPDELLSSTFQICDDIKGALRSSAFKAETRGALSQMMDAGVSTAEYQKIMSEL